MLCDEVVPRPAPPRLTLRWAFPRERQSFPPDARPYREAPLCDRLPAPCARRDTMGLSADQVSLIGQVFESYVMEHHRDDILAILREADEQAHYPVVVDALTLFETNMEIGEYFNAFPSEVLPVFDSALRRAALAALQESADPAQLSLKQNLHARVSGECRAGAAASCTSQPGLPASLGSSGKLPTFPCSVTSYRGAME